MTPEQNYLPKDKINDRLTYLSTLAGGLVHEIRNPLSTISMNLQLIGEDFKAEDDPKAQRNRRRVEKVLKEVQRLEGILGDFLRFTKGHVLKLEAVDVPQLLSGLVELIVPEAARLGIKVLTSYQEKLPQVKVDPDYLKQALLNLIINARDAMPKGGELMVRARQEGENLRIDITDTGSGIPADKIKKIFQVYFSTKKGGTGLGLPTARRIIEEHEGRIGVQSEEGKGTNFMVILPLRTYVRDEGMKGEPA